MSAVTIHATHSAPTAAKQSLELQDQSSGLAKVGRRSMDPTQSPPPAHELAATLSAPTPSAATSSASAAQPLAPSAHRAGAGGARPAGTGPGAKTQAEASRPEDIYAVTSAHHVAQVVQALTQAMAQRQAERKEAMHTDNWDNGMVGGANKPGTGHDSDMAFDGTTRGTLYLQLAHALRHLYILNRCTQRQLLRRCVACFAGSTSILKRRLEYTEAELSLLHQQQAVEERAAAAAAAKEAEAEAAAARAQHSLLGRINPFSSSRRRGAKPKKGRAGEKAGKGGGGRGEKGDDSDEEGPRGTDATGSLSGRHTAAATRLKRKARGMSLQVDELRQELARAATYHAIALLSAEDAQGCLRVLTAVVAQPSTLHAVLRRAKSAPRPHTKHPPTRAWHRAKAEAEASQDTLRAATAALAVVCYRIGFLGCAAELLECVLLCCGSVRVLCWVVLCCVVLRCVGRSVDWLARCGGTSVSWSLTLLIWSDLI